MATKKISIKGTKVSPFGFQVFNPNTDREEVLSIDEVDYRLEVISVREKDFKKFLSDLTKEVEGYEIKKRNWERILNKLDKKESGLLLVENKWLVKKLLHTK
jgi:hypothetical protein